MSQVLVSTVYFVGLIGIDDDELEAAGGDMKRAVENRVRASGTTAVEIAISDHDLS